MKMEKIYVFGHKNPDTDSILSSIIRTDYLKSKWFDVKTLKLSAINNETKFLLYYIWLQEPETVEKLPENSNICLVDHNDFSQSADNIETLNIVQLIDHHNIWNFHTNKPLFIRTEPLCSTCSVMYKIFKENNYNIDKKIATCIIAWIISDSLFFRSPTTTEEDKQAVEQLNKIAQIDNIENFAVEMFNAKSDLGNISAMQIIKTDYKEFQVNNKKFGVWVLETTNPNYALNKEEELIQALKQLKQESSLDFIMFSIIDIFKEENITLVGTDEDVQILKKVFNIEKEENNRLYLGNVLSRKKQIVPNLTEFFSKQQ